MLPLVYRVSVGKAVAIPQGFTLSIQVLMTNRGVVQVAAEPLDEIFYGRISKVVIARHERPL